MSRGQPSPDRVERPKQAETRRAANVHPRPDLRSSPTAQQRAANEQAGAPGLGSEVKPTRLDFRDDDEDQEHAVTGAATAG